MTSFSSENAARSPCAESEGSWEFASVLAGTHSVEHFTETVQIGLREARPFGRNESLRSYIGACFVDAGDQTYVGKLGRSTDKDNVRRLDIPVYQPMSMEVGQGIRDGDPDLQAFGYRKRPRLSISVRSVLGRYPSADGSPA